MGTQVQKKSMGLLKRQDNDLKAEIKPLKKENARLKMERDILKSDGVLHKGSRVKYAWIKEHTGAYPIGLDMFHIADFPKRLLSLVPTWQQTGRS